MTDVWRDVIEELADQPIFGAGREDWPVPTRADCALDDDGTTRLERTPVVLDGGTWTLVVDGKAYAGAMAPKNTRGVVALKSSDDSTRWMGFALIGKGPHDIRPDLLALVWQRSLIGVERCIQYGASYLLASGHDLDTDLLQAAAADALLILTYGETRGDGTGRKRADGRYTAGGQVKRHRPRRPTLRSRDDQFKLAHGTWGTLRDAALKAYRRRYREAVALFTDMDNWRPQTNGRSYASGFPDDKLDRGQWSPHRQRMVVWIEAVRSGRLTSPFRHNGVQTSPHRHGVLVSRRLAA